MTGWGMNINQDVDVESVKIAINKEIAVNDELLSDGCEVAFLPPVTGG